MKIFEKKNSEVNERYYREYKEFFKNDYLLFGKTISCWKMITTPNWGTAPEHLLFNFRFSKFRANMRCWASGGWVGCKVYHQIIGLALNPDYLLWKIKYTGKYNPIQKVLSFFSNRKRNAWIKTLPECYNPCVPFYSTCNSAGHKPECAACMEKNGLVDYVE